VTTVDEREALRFLCTAFEPDDWIAVFLRCHETGQVRQRVGPLARFLQPSFHRWLRAMNAQRFNVYVSVNTIRPGCRRRTKDAIAAVRHVFLEADHDGCGLLERIGARRDLPRPSYILESSPGRVHVFWRASGFTAGGIEGLERLLARDLDTDIAATTCSQTTRLPGFRNHKRRPSHLVRAVYTDVVTRYTPGSFPNPPEEARRLCGTSCAGTVLSTDCVARARRYLARVPPAIAGEHGDRQTFKVACKLVRGFALSDSDALLLFSEWNRGCCPPWAEIELRTKLAAARRYGTELPGGLARQATRADR
jgi:hypothetical protein